MSALTRFVLASAFTKVPALQLIKICLDVTSPALNCSAKWLKLKCRRSWVNWLENIQSLIASKTDFRSLMILSHDWLLIAWIIAHWPLTSERANTCIPLCFYLEKPVLRWSERLQRIGKNDFPPWFFNYYKYTNILSIVRLNIYH